MLGIACYGAPAFAGAETVAGVTVLRPDPVANAATPEPAPGGVAVLQGVPPVPAEPANTATGTAPPVAASARTGWDSTYDTTGIDRSDYNTTGIDPHADRHYDVTGFDRRLDRTGLGHP